ncbi:MAG TPA: hypothetical protein VF582_04975 [Allosphingosinicella sp.]|jgi:hypothetical protein
MKPTLIASALALALTACGDHLGNYQVEQVQLVQQMPAAATVDGNSPPYPLYVRVELTSQTNLNAADTGPGLYTHAGLCPLRDPDRIAAFGPVASDGGAVESWRRETPLMPYQDDRLYHYFVYIVPQFPMTERTGEPGNLIPDYDLTRNQRDVCLRFSVPGYNITPSHSGVTKIPARTLAAAFDSHQASR